MSFQTLEAFLFWSLIINSGLYLLTVIAVLTMKGFVYKVHNRLFGLNEESVDHEVLRYLANFKLLILVFNLTPWLALLIIQ